MGKRRCVSGSPTGCWPRRTCPLLAREQGLKLAAKPPMALRRQGAAQAGLKQAVRFVIDLEAPCPRPGLQGKGAKPHRQQAAAKQTNPVETEPAYQLTQP